MADATLTIEPIEFDFDVIMGQDLTYPVTYGVVAVAFECNCNVPLW